MKIKKLLLTCVLLTTILLVGCSDTYDSSYDYQDNDADIADADIIADTNYEAMPSLETPIELIEYYLHRLTSEEFAGRMAGTHGSELVIEWLSDRLSAIGIEHFYGNSYRVPYLGRTNSFEKSEVNVMYNGETTKLIQGIDFFVSLNQGSFNSIVQSGMGDYLFLEIGDLGGPISTEDYEILFIRRGNFQNFSYAPTGAAQSGGRFVQLSDETFELLSSGAFDSIEVTNTVSYAYLELDHVVGKIRGADSTAAVVLSAHFDHLGEGGATFFPGAFDNASGTAALLYIAERLYNISVEFEFEFDLIFAFFNNEEHIADNGRPLGSQEFVSSIMREYDRIYSINIDCLGYYENESFLTGDFANALLLEEVVSFFGERDIYMDTSMTIMSDNANFIHYGIASVNFTSANFGGSNIPHSNEDVVEILFIEQILRVSQAIVDFIVERGSYVFQAPEQPHQDIGNETYELDYAALNVQFHYLFENLRHGEEVRFYDDFYIYLPNERQFYFSVYEVIENNEQIRRVQNFGDYELRLIRGPDDFEHQGLIYFNINDPDEISLTIIPTTAEFVAHLHDTEAITYLDGISLWTPPLLDGRIMGFIYSDGVSYFRVHISNSRAEIINDPHRHEGFLLFVSSPPSRLANDPEAMVEFILDLQFHEFVEAWVYYGEE